jgi:hypothetical protein
MTSNIDFKKNFKVYMLIKFVLEKTSMIFKSRKLKSTI